MGQPSDRVNGLESIRLRAGRQGKVVHKVNNVYRRVLKPYPAAMPRIHRKLMRDSAKSVIYLLRSVVRLKQYS